jgi:hypothetical protein
MYKKFKGIEYKSKGEYEIAKLLHKLGFEFEYEFPIAIVDDKKPKLWYPDFYLKEYQVVVEYFGMYAHNTNYANNADHKKEVYKDCGIQFVSIYHINKKWEEYLLKSILAHQEMKAKKMKHVLENYNKSDGGKSNIIKKLYDKVWK